MEAFLSAVGNLGTPLYWISVTIAVFLAVLVGMVPGVGGLVVMAILLPFVVFHIDNPAIAIVMLATITGANNTLDSIPAVVVGIPSGATQVTFLEGHQLARQGKAAHTLGAIYAVSAIGGVVGALCLLAAIPVIKPFILGFDRGEIAVLALFGVTMISVLSRGAMLKGLSTGLFGILVATVGTDAFTGERRYTFGQIELWTGLPLIAVITGVFAVPELIDLTMTRKPVAAQGAVISRAEMFRGALYGLKRWKEAIRQSIFGVFVGAIPGVGGGVVDWLAYAFGILFRKNRSEFGKGSLDGVLFAEAAQNSKEGGQALPTLTLGVPGGASWAIVIAAMLLYGVAPGPPMLDRHLDITMLLVITLAVSNVMVTMLGLVASAPLLHLTRIPYVAIAAVLIPLVFLAAFLNAFIWLAIPIVAVFAVIGLLFKRFGWPRPPFVLGFILGPIIDNNIQGALSLYGPVGLMTRPLTIVLFILVIVATAALTYFMGRTEQQVAQQPAGGVPRGGSLEPDAAKLRWRKPYLGLDNLATLLMIAGAAAFLWGSLDFAPRARMVPMWISIAIIVLAGTDFIRQTFWRDTREVQLMDLGMRSRGQPGAVRSGLIVGGMIILFLLAAMIIRLDNAAILFAAILPLVLMTGWIRYVTAVVTTLVMLLWTYAFMGYFMAVLWPSPALWNWFRNGFF